MKVNYIKVKAKPDDRPEWVGYKGELLKNKEVVATFPEMWGTIGYEFLPEMVLGSFDPPVEADTLLLDGFDIDYSHTVEIDGKQFLMKPGVSDEWVSHTLGLRPSLVPWILGIIFLSVILKKKRRGN